MPKVPRYDNPQVRPQSVGAPRLSVDTHGSFGQSVGEGLQRLGGGLGRASDQLAAIAQDERRRADAVALSRAKSKYRAALTLGQEAVLKEVGEAAIPASDRFVQEAAKLRDEILQKDLHTEEQRAEFGELSHQMYEGADARVQHHITGQLEVAGKNALELEAVETEKALALDYANPKARAEHLRSLEESIRRVVREPGAAELAVGKMHQRAAGIVLNQRLSHNDVKGARADLAQLRGILGPDVAARYEADIGRVERSHEAERLAQEFDRRHRDPRTGWADPAKSYAELDTIQDPEMKKEARLLLAQRMNTAKAQEQAEVDKVYERAFSALINGRFSLSAIDRQDRNWLIRHQPKAWYDLMQMASSQLERSRSVPPTPHQQLALTKLAVDMADHPERYATMSAETFARDWFPLLARRDWDRAGGMLAAHHGRAGAPVGLTPLDHRMLLRIGRDAGVFPRDSNDLSKWESDDAASTYYAVQQMVEDRASAYRKANGKPPPDSELEKWMRQALLRGKVPGSGVFFDDTTTRVQAERAGKLFEPEFSDEDREAAERALKAAGFQKVDERAVETYLRRKNELPALPISAAEPEEPKKPEEPADPKPPPVDVQKETRRRVENYMRTGEH